MKNIFPFLMLMLIACSRLFAVTINETEAQTVALNFYTLHSQKSGHSGALSATLTFTRTENDGSVDYYAFNMEPKGFVIVTADDNFEPVIAWSSESYFNPNAGQVGVTYWMNQSAAKIVTGKAQGVKADEHISTLWSAYKTGQDPGVAKSTTIGPLTTSTWNQENDLSTPPPYLYNLYCPYNSTDKQRCVTGCVATAMAQIMYYWKYPATGSGSYSYSYNNTTSGDSYNYGTMSANFGATTYPWSIMPAALTLTTTGAQDSAVDLISYHAGVSVAMEYGDDNQGGSGAFVLQSDAGGSNPCAQKSYTTYFGYNPSTIQGVYASNYSASAWVTLLENELNASRVIQYAGYESNGGGHTWVCDGYETSPSTMFHMNWGWQGYDNGYYSIGNLDPNPYTFNNYDEALIGIEPNTASCGGASNLTAGSLSATGATLSWSAVNNATSYNLEWKASSASSWTTVTGLTSATYPLTGLAGCTAYQFAVQAVCSSGSSAYSAAVSFTTTCSASCGGATGLTIGNLSTTGATLTWGTVSGATSYNLEWKASSANSWTIVTGLTSATSGLTGLVSCTAYQFAVQAVCSSGSSAYSAAVSFTTTCPPSCGSATGLTAGSLSTTGATLSWTAVSGATSYNLEWKTSSANSWTTVTGLTSATYGLSGLASCTAYQFEVQAVCSSGSSAYSAAVSFTTTGCSAPPLSYCTAKSTNTSYMYIKNVTLGSINNTTAAGSAGYINYTNLSTSLTAGSTYTITVSPGFPSYAYTVGFAVFIDYSQSGVFTNAGNMVAELEGTSTLSKSFTVPTTAVNGATRMRIIMDYDAYETNPCATIVYGQVQDYTVNITGGAAGEELNAMDEMASHTMNALTLYPNPAQNYLSAHFTSDNDGVVRINIYNITGQRMLSMENASAAGENTQDINTSTLNSGIYVFEIENNGTVQRQKFVISK